MALEEMSLKHETPCVSTNDLNIITESIEDSSCNESNKIVDEFKEECLTFEQSLFDNADQVEPSMVEPDMSLELRTESGCEVPGVENEHLYLDHEVKDELVVGPEVLQEPASSSTVQDSHKGAKPVKPFECNVCHERFTFENNLQVHLRRHNATLIIKCDVCLKQFTGAKSYDIHRRCHTRVRRYACQICDKLFTSKQILDNHFRIHSGEKPYTCDVCNKQFKQRGHLYEHSMLHTDGIQHKCNQCGKEFRRKSNLHRHILMHARPKRVLFACECGKRFYTQAKLDIHAKRHSAKNNSCQTCGKDFQKKSQLRKHEKTHELYCRLCGELFRLRSDLIEHKAVHKDQQLFPCEMCGKKFKRRFGLKTHVLLKSCVKKDG